KVFKFVWDHEEHKAIMSSHRINHFVKFEYLPESEADEADPSYFELRLELNELTQTTFLKVTDYADFDDLDELEDLWEGLIENLRKVVGG
ncbi:MAG TPA: START-like domain-containing protein, partial [Cyclobacteriaceae bacterium]|nr:START-like domain-containing protein [Cyclobacteriaceae bacterium]